MGLANQVTLWHVKSPELINVLRELEHHGLYSGRDFEFAYYQAKYDDDSFNAVVRPHTVFTFNNEADATWFSLKWG
jgi:hypothetical protein